MQLIDYALIGLAIAAPTSQAASIKKASICPGLDGTHVQLNQGTYRINCGKWADVGPEGLLNTTFTHKGYKSCLKACDADKRCGIAEYVASDYAQTKGTCFLYQAGEPIKVSHDSSWTLITNVEKAKHATRPKHAPLPNHNPPPPGKNDKFSLAALRSGTPGLHGVPVIASHGQLRVSLYQDASCVKDASFATFFIKDGEAFLYTDDDVPQQLWVDRSWMGSGAVGYTTGEQSAPKNAERKGFRVDEKGDFAFDGVYPMACPPKKGQEQDGWSLWFTSSWKVPGFQDNECVGPALWARKEDKPIACSYTSSQEE